MLGYCIFSQLLMMKLTTMLQKTNYSTRMRIDWELYGRILQARANYTDEELELMREKQKALVSINIKKGAAKPLNEHEN